MTTRTITARREGDPQHYVEGKNWFRLCEPQDMNATIEIRNEFDLLGRLIFEIYT